MSKIEAWLICTVLMGALAGCVSNQPTPLTPSEIGDLSVVVTLEFGDRSNETTSLSDRLENGSLTFDPVLVAPGTSAYRVMESLQIRENFTMEVTFYTFGPYIDTIDGVAGDDATYWSLEQNGTAATVGAGDLLIEADTDLAWVLADASAY